MMRKLVVAVILLIGSYVGWRGYNYYFNAQAPDLEVAELADGAYYGGNIDAIIKGSSRCKIDHLSAWLDDKQVINKELVGSSSLYRPLTFVTTRLSNGQHTFKIEAVDGSRNRNKATKAITFFVDNAPLQARFAALDSEFKVLQGRTLHVPVQLNKRVKNVKLTIFSRDFVGCSDGGYSTIYDCYVPVETEALPGVYPFVVNIEDYLGHTAVLHGTGVIEAAVFKKQVLHHIDTAKFEEERRLGKTEAELAGAMERVAKQSPCVKYWHGAFDMPIHTAAITCDFGTKRVSQERGCYTHNALDLIGHMPNTVVWAPQAGVVAIKDRFGVTGNTVVIDHGCGVVTLLCHLDRFADIAVGSQVRRGTPVGVTGKTGYATGDHLHWEMRVGNIQVDPAQWTKVDF